MLKVYNTLKRKVEPFKPRKGKDVSIYVCGPTVYDYSHIGHARTYVAFDVIVRYLRHRGYDVKYVVNITNVEDKIINRAREMGINPLELAEKFEKAFFNDMAGLGVIKADLYPRVSDHIPEIIEVIQTLIKKGFGYEVEGDVYFDVNKFKDYGKLSHQSLDSIKAGARVEVDERKRSPADFALWKKAKEGEIFWESPWGRGRPGWHIECSAMSNEYLGAQFEVHGGGRDLIFPHHENEIAQSEAYTGKRPVVKYWLHCGLLTINGEKMSKSLGNIVSIEGLLHRYKADVIRLYMISTHYRRPINFIETDLEGTKQRLARIQGTIENLREKIEASSAVKEKKTGGMVEFEKQAKAAKEKFLSAMDDDFNTPRALAAFYRTVQIGNKALVANARKMVLIEVLKLITAMTQVLGIFEKKSETEGLPEEAEKLLKEREVARSRKDWGKADELRKKLRERGIILEDLPEGTKWKYGE